MSTALRDIAWLETQARAALGAHVRLAALCGGAAHANGTPADAVRAIDRRRGRATLAQLLEQLARNEPADAVHFPHPELSLSHSGDWAIAAGCAQAGGVGVDLEFARPMDARAARFFLAGRECDYIDTLAGDAKCGELLRLWTAKEAVFKACADNAGRLLTDFALDDPAARAGAARGLGGCAFTARYVSIDLGAGWLSIALANAPAATPADMVALESCA
jgi:hypothetical protein